MMTAGGRKSPVHVHVDRETPVHVHLKKKKKSRPGVPTAVEQRLKTKKLSGFTKSTGHRKAMKSASPPFVPPPGKTSMRPFAWEGTSHRLEVSPPAGSGTLRMEDLSTSEEDDVNGKIRTYEKKIGSLMTEVGSLKNEMEIQRARQVAEKKDEQLNASRRILEAQEDELLGYKQELKATVKENEALRHSVEKWREDASVTRTEVGKLAGERAALLKKLVEVEMDGKAAGEQLLKLRDTVRKLKEDKRMSAADTTLLTRQREMLLQKLDEFERTNKALRRLLREQQATEEEHDNLLKQQEVLLKRLTQSDTTNERLQVEVAERDRQIETLLSQVEADKDQAVAFEELKKTMETTRAHLQNQLRSKEMESNRLSVQIRSLEDQGEQGRLELEHMQGLLAAQREKSTREKEALKKAARMQKDRVGEREKDLEILQEKLAERDMALNETKRSEASLKEERGDAELEIRTLKSRVKELHEMMESSEKDAQSNSDALTAKLSGRTQEVNALRLENEQLKADIAALEERLHEEEQRAASKIDRYRREAEETKNRLYEYEADSQRQQQEHALENEKVLEPEGPFRAVLSSMASSPVSPVSPTCTSPSPSFKGHGELGEDVTERRIVTRAPRVEPLWHHHDRKAMKSGQRGTIYWVGKQILAEDGSRTGKVEKGASYQGEWDGNQKNGYGVQVFPNGQKYEGQWANGMRNGEGTLWVPFGKAKKLRKLYVGGWKDDKRHGRGTCFFSDGHFFQGDWTQGKMHGEGLLRYSNGDLYIGGWCDGLRSGEGTLTKANGDCYEGFWYNDLREGSGSYFYAESGKVFVGEWASDLPKAGVYTQANSNPEQATPVPQTTVLPPVMLAFPNEVLEGALAAVREVQKIGTSFRECETPPEMSMQTDSLEGVV